MPSPSSPAEPLPELETLRARYQKGLLAWLKAPDSGAGLDAMIAALTALSPPHDLWQAARQLLAAIHAQRLPARVEYRRLAGRVDQALRRAAQGQAPDDPELQHDLSHPLAQLDPPPQARIEALIPRSPLASTLEATAAILPLMAESREPRFSAAQRQSWDTAVAALQHAWDERLNTWQPMRQSIFRLLEGALPLAHPAPLRLAEALASATDTLEMEAPGPRRLAALSATLELLQEADFLEHPALETRVAQLVPRLEAPEDKLRSPALEALFTQEAGECLEHLHLALEAVPPDMEALALAAEQLRELADYSDKAELAASAAQLARLAHALPASQLDKGLGRNLAQQCLEQLHIWIHPDNISTEDQSACDGSEHSTPPVPPAVILANLLQRLEAALPSR